MEPDHWKGSLKTNFRRRLGPGLWVDRRWPWIQTKGSPPLVASLVGDVLRGVGTCQLTHPPWSWRSLFNIVSSLWPLNWVINGGKKKNNNQKTKQHNLLLFFILLFIFGCAGSSLLQWLFSSFRERGLLCGCGAQDSRCRLLSL